ncbi:hypothetical protein HUT19_41015 [Streptomyces sp. NA02950]|uniref:hypothetical protein n=1 Tax=Streptomyces sp. NA02950 TaxID=2742137 RepID=UPI00158FCAC7|nr:hypothetical protein [Streptomyces sp. NA02950]QKV90402.1 hypothetical protein HUT19_00205 [Streptomyces sp. NA02950]QKV97265.1 hypothetical protein HUT19_41015 [Streptomyces sp. NA02950]
MALSVSSCSGGDGKSEESKHPSKPAASSPQSSQTTASSDPQAPDKRDVLTAYRHYWDEQVKAYSKVTVEGTDLDEYASADALARAKSDVMSLKKAGVVAKGAPVNDAKVSGLDMDRKVPRATIADCLDVSKWTRVDRKTGKTVPSPKGQLKRYATTINAEKWGKQWMILKVTSKPRTC